MSGLALDSVTRDMQHAAAPASQMLAQQYAALPDQFSDADEAGTLAAQEAESALDSQHWLTLPLVSLTMPRGLVLNEIAVNTTVRNGITETLPVYGATTGGAGRLYVSLTSHSKHDTGRGSEHINIRIKFTALQTPEVIMCVIDEYTNRLVPRPVQPNTETPNDRVNPSTPRERSNKR